MSYIPLTEYESSNAEVKSAYDDQIKRHGRITNMKRTLLHCPPAFNAYMQWYDLFDRLALVIGTRATHIFSYAISEGNDCLVCGTFFRKILIDAGEDLENLSLSKTEALLFDFGLSISKNPHSIPEKIYSALRESYTDQELVLIIAFAGLMSATNLFNTLAKVPLDEVLYSYESGKERGEENV